MQGKYQGELTIGDPLYVFLAEHVLREVLEVEVQQPIFAVYQINENGVIYGYHERNTGIALLCKFYGNRDSDDNGVIDQGRMAELMHLEYENLRKVWNLGLNHPPYRVVRPLAVSETLNYILVEEYVSGPELDVFLKEAFQQDRFEVLHARIGRLAEFLATLHARSQREAPVDSRQGLDYLAKVIDQLATAEVIDDTMQGRLMMLRTDWANAGVLETAKEVWVHGDVTPVNIVYDGGGGVIAIDLERLHAGDAARDLGMAMAEFHHAFLLHGKDPAASTPLIEHFFNRYGEIRQQDEATLSTLYERSHFFMGTMMLRICRNDWLDLAYRRSLVLEAEQCLQR